MSDFAVTVEWIDKVWKHTNADKLEMVSLVNMSYDLVVMKGQYTPGDVVIFFPIDSILPTNITDTINLTGKLSGKNKNIIKTVKLRGNISQGIVISPSILYDNNILLGDISPGEDLTERLGVEKYDPPTITSKDGSLKPLPDFVNKLEL